MTVGSVTASVVSDLPRTVGKEGNRARQFKNPEESQPEIDYGSGGDDVTEQQ